MIELSKAPINQFENSSLRVNNYVLRLDISVHNPFRMTVVKSFEKLVQIISDLYVPHWGNHRPKICILKVVENLHRKHFTKQLLLEAGSLTTSLSSIMLGCPLTAKRILISLFILLFFTGFNTLITTFWSVVVSIPKLAAKWYLCKPLNIFPYQS